MLLEASSMTATCMVDQDFVHIAGTFGPLGVPSAVFGSLWDLFGSLGGSLRSECPWLSWRI